MESSVNPFREACRKGWSLGKKLLRTIFIVIMILFGVLSLLQIAFAVILWLDSIGT
ncbi:hypothetical protein YSY43_01330 [Paenibacillus sp. YSY-4.3]